MANEQRIRDSDLLRMFPTFVWRAQLGPDVATPINDAIVRKLGELGAPLDELEPGESWQSGHDLQRLEEFRDLADLIDEAAGSVLDHLKIGHKGFRITGCWANVNAPGAGHRAHSHPNNFLSGVYYVRTHPGADTINFRDPRPQTGIIRPPVRELGAETADQVAVTVKDGTLLMFPAWLEHSVDPNRSGRARVSIGFNVMFAAFSTVMGRPSWEAGTRRPPGS